jgi:hypothetical protein
VLRGWVDICNTTAAMPGILGWYSGLNLPCQRCFAISDLSRTTNSCILKLSLVCLKLLILHKCTKSADCLLALWWWMHHLLPAVDLLCCNCNGACCGLQWKCGILLAFSTSALISMFAVLVSWFNCLHVCPQCVGPAAGYATNPMLLLVSKKPP